jgi:hypothetical protein
MSTIAPTTLLDDLHPARFLKVSDLLERWKVQSIIVTISRMTSEETIPNPRDIDPDTHKPRVIVQPVLYFVTKTGGEFPRGYLLSAGADVQALKTAANAHTIADLTGKKITIKVDAWKGKAVLRIDPTPIKES